MTGSGAPRWLWMVLLAGAPLALVAGGMLYYSAVSEEVPRIGIGRAEALERARNAARARGLDASRWKEILHFLPAPERERYWSTHPHRAGTEWLREISPIGVFRVHLAEPGSERWVQVRLCSQGKLLAFEQGVVRRGPPPGLRPRTADPPGAIPFDESGARARAFEEARKLVGADSPAIAGQPLMELPGPRFARRFVWRVIPENSPEMEVTTAVEIDGERVTKVSTGGNLRPEAVRALDDRASGFIGMLRVVTLVLLCIYALYRFARRFADGEAPTRRSLLLAILFLLLGVATVILDPYLAGANIQPQQLRGSLLATLMVAMLGFYMLEGLLLGLAYGAGEGELREAYRDKLTSLDALLNGRWNAANSGVAVLAGAAVAGWVALALGGAAWLLRGRLASFPAELLGTMFGPASVFQTVFFAPVSGLLQAVCGLMIPLMFLRRHVRSRELRGGLALLLAVAGVAAVSPLNLRSLHDPMVVLAMTAGLVVAFRACDLLAAITAVSVLHVVVNVVRLSAIVPSAQTPLLWLAAVGMATLLAFCIPAFRGRWVSDEEVRPHYAGKIANRLALRAEIEAAREAQHRLLPGAAPEHPGLALAASCHAAREVSGDFYDFLPLPNGRLGLLVADGRRGGIEAALTIAFAKGYLQAARERDAAPEQLLREIEPWLVHAAESARLLYARIDPPSGAVEIARRGDSPRCLVRRCNGTIEEAGSARFTLLEGETLVLLTDGVFARLEEVKAAPLRDLLAPGTLEAMHRHLIEAAAVSGELHDDLTVVLVRRGGAAAEAVA